MGFRQWAGAVLLPGVPLFFTILLGYVLWQGIRGVAVIVGFSFAMLWFVIALITMIHDRTRVRIIPYYDQCLPEADTFLSGHALARNCLHLDRLAEEKQLKTISAFGFNDGALGETVVWYDAAHGLPTIYGLLDAVKAAPESVDDVAAVVSDLQRIRKALEAASAKEIRFAFLLELGDGTSGWIWHLRKGYS
jgi:hypothetical protein